ncbi:MAG: hypothetical protein AABM42_11040 [Actinomycetota bacterium]
MSELLWRPGLHRRQHAGVLGLFGRASASGAPHELDGVGMGHELGVWLESKARAALEKSDVATFQLKCFDLYRAAAAEFPRNAAESEWWPVLVSSEDCAESVRRVCCATGIVLCEPSRFPLPALLHTAAKPQADEFLAEGALGELVRLGEPACQPMQDRWRIDADRRTITSRLDTMSPRETGELLFLQDELSGDLLDAFDIDQPGHLERRGGRLAEQLERAALTV